MNILKENLDHNLLLEQALDDFAVSSCNPFSDEEKISFFEKIANEREAKKIIEKALRKLEPFREKNEKNLTQSDKDEIRTLFMGIAEELDKKKIFFDEPFLTYFMKHGYLDSTELFFASASLHDDSLEFKDLFQAVRNVWIMNSLQLLFDLDVEMTPAIFSYSMLYPYTDNYLDDPLITRENKKRFNDRLQSVIEGRTPSDSTHEEKKIFSMIHNIEEQYKREDYPLVYRSLLLIHEAQVTSLSQSSSTKLSPSIILPISFFKGGTSVLADAYLVKGYLTEKEMDFAFGYGAFLQLMDDLQDIESDRKDCHWTLFSVKSKEEIFDNEVTKLLCYITKVLDKQTFGTPKERMLKKIIKDCTRLMVSQVIGSNPHLVSEKLYKSIESCSKVRLSFYREYGERFSSNSALWDKTASPGSAVTGIGHSRTDR